jgi:ribosomal-protein-alanine N-acetyltransferase
VKLRFADVSDCQILARLHADAFEKPWDAAHMTTLLAGPGVFAQIAEGDDGPIGFILARTAADEAEVLTLAVEPQHWRQGVGSALVAGAAGAAVVFGARSLFLEVAADNVEALGLYRKRGFVAVGHRKGYYDQGAADAVVMRLDLNSGLSQPYHQEC